MRLVYPIAGALATAVSLLAAAATAPAPSPSPADGPLVVFLGDSLTAGLGVDEDQAFPAVVGRRLREAGTPVRIVNAGVSGDTTAGGLRRLDWVLSRRPDVLVVGLGANDALRGQPVEGIRANLDAIVKRARASGAEVLLLGMRIPTNYGRDYTEAFAAVYPAVAKASRVPLVPFLLEGVGGREGLNQADGLHPTAAGHALLAENVLPYLRPLVGPKRGQRRRRAVAGRQSGSPDARWRRSRTT